MDVSPPIGCLTKAQSSSAAQGPRRTQSTILKSCAKNAVQNGGAVVLLHINEDGLLAWHFDSADGSEHASALLDGALPTMKHDMKKFADGFNASRYRAHAAGATTECASFSFVAASASIEDSSQTLASRARPPKTRNFSHFPPAVRSQMAGRMIGACSVRVD